MTSKQITIPKFHTEKEEAEWWDSHPEVATELMNRAIKSGKAKRAVPLKTVTMRLSISDIKAAQDLALKKGLAEADLDMARKQAEEKGLP